MRFLSVITVRVGFFSTEIVFVILKGNDYVFMNCIVLYSILGFCIVLLYFYEILLYIVLFIIKEN